MTPDRDEVKNIVAELLSKHAARKETSRPSAAYSSATTIDESMKSVLTEEDLRDVPEGAEVRIREDCRLTPLAEELVAAKRMTLTRWKSPRERLKRKIALGADHGGFEMKEQLKQFLTQLGYAFMDFGANSAAAVDYPDFAHAVGKAVSSGQYELGIVIDGAGIGSCMAANKVPGVRAALCYNVATARNSREHNDANVLTLGGRMTGELQMREIVHAWLSADCTEERHKQRVEKIKAIERSYLR